MPTVGHFGKNMNLQQAIESVARSGWLSRQPMSFVQNLRDICELRPLKAGERLTSLGDPGGSILGLASGTLNVFIASGPFPPFLCYIAHPGWWTGEAAAATQSARRVEQVARVDCQILVIPSKGLRDLVLKDPETWRRLEEITVGHMDHALELACIRGGSDKWIQTVSTLLRLANQFPADQKQVEINVKQAEIAEMAGLSRNSVGPVLSALTQNGAVTQRYGALLVDRDKLSKALPN